ncbi:unnamed protein product, partial [Lampetra fluviatilis]
FVFFCVCLSLCVCVCLSVCLPAAGSNSSRSSSCSSTGSRRQTTYPPVSPFWGASAVERVAATIPGTHAPSRTSPQSQGR